MIVRTSMGLDALPPGAVVLDKDGDAWQKDVVENYWWTGGETETKSSERIMRHAPFRTMRVVDQ